MICEKKRLKLYGALTVMVSLLFALMLCFCGNTYSAVAEGTRAETVQEGADEPETGETVAPEETPGGETKFDLDAFLAFVQGYADEAGVGNEYAKAVEAIKTAATQKQVTISTIINGVLLLVMLVYVIAKSVKQRKERAAISSASSQLTRQTSAMNDMIDELNTNETTAKETKKQILNLETGFRDFIKAFMTFVDRTRVDKESKEAIKHELNAAIRNTDGETEAGADEDQAQ